MDFLNDMFTDFDFSLLFKIIIAVAISLVAFKLLNGLIKTIFRVISLIVIFLIVMYLLNIF